jgi:hypothetical protein
MEKKYIKDKFNLEDFISEIGSINNKISGFKHESGVLIIYLKEVLNPSETVLLDSLVLNHEGIYRKKIEPVSPRQIRTALVISGVSIQAIEQGLDSLNEPERSIAKIAWEFSNEFNRNNPLVDSLAPLLGLTQEQLDSLWELAKTL